MVRTSFGDKVKINIQTFSKFAAEHEEDITMPESFPVSILIYVTFLKGTTCYHLLIMKLFHVQQASRIFLQKVDLLHSIAKCVAAVDGICFPL